MRRGIDEDGRVVEVLFLAEFAQEQHGELDGSGRKQSHVEEFPGCGTDSRVESAAFVVDLNHGFVDRDVIWRGAVGRLEIGLLHPVVDGGSTAADINLSSCCLVIESDRSARWSLIPI